MTTAPAATTSPSPTALATPAATPTATSTPTPTPTPTSPSEPLTSFGDGEFRVGVDIAPGRYRAVAPSEGCAWGTGAASGEYGRVSVPNKGEPRMMLPLTVADVVPGDERFVSEGCGEWSPDLVPIAEPGQPFDDGTYIVGLDIAPGRYRAAAPSDSCFWLRLRDFRLFGGKYGSHDVRTTIGGWGTTVLGGDVSSVVDIEPTDAGFYSAGCGTWTNDLTPIATPGQPFPDGTYIVGDEIAPGRYRAREPSAECYWARLGDFSGKYGEGGNYLVIRRTGPTSVVDLAPEDAGFYSRGCGTWSDDLSPVTTPGEPFPDGTYLVGVDIAPGRYRATGATHRCVWYRLHDFSGIYGGYEGAFAISTGWWPAVDVAPWDAGLLSIGCGTWTDATTPLAEPGEPLGDGVYLVGIDIAPGRYRASGASEDCSWWRLNGFQGDPSFGYGPVPDIIAHGDSTTVDIFETDVGFRTSSCGTWFESTALPTEPPTPPSTQTRPELPTSPTFDAPPGLYTAISVGAAHACALTEDGEAICWRIESAETREASAGSYRFVTAEGADTCSISAGGEIACLSRGEDPWTPLGEGTPRYTAVVDDCGLTEEGSIECWGVWPGRWPDPPSEPLVAINGLRKIGGFGTEYYRRCALTATGDIVCWGSDTLSDEPWNWRKAGDYVALAGFGGCGLTSSGHWDCLASHLTGEERYVAISTTGRHHCAVAENGKAVCGPVSRGLEGQVARMIPPDPSPERFVAISVGESPDWESGVELIYACALTDSGRAVCWANEPNTLPHRGAEHGPYVAVSDGSGHTCALTTAGEAVCWGWNNFGQADVPPGSYTAISAGHVATCAITAAAEAVCWGAWAPELPPGSYVDISMAYERACALTAQGEVVCGDSYGLLTDRDGPLAEVPPGPFVDVAHRWTHACARTEAGNLVCWGHGYGATEVPPGRYLAVSVHDSSTCAIVDTGEAACWGRALNDPPPGTYVAISAGGRHACVLTDTGEATCWGSFVQLRGQDGHGPVTPPPGEYIALSSSSFRACALTTGGEVVCWGDDGYQQRPWFSPE